MMLTPEQLDAIRGEAEAISEHHPSKDARAFALSALAALNTQQEEISSLNSRIAERNALSKATFVAFI